MAATIKDVAEKALVSSITVSRVINGRSNVHADTRARVLAAIEELQYIPNDTASNLRSSQTTMLALLLPTIVDSFWMTIARGVEDEAEARGYGVLLCNTDDDTIKEARYLESLLRRRVAGVVIVPTTESGPQLQRLRRQGLPLVQIHRKVSQVEADVVRADSYGGARALTTNLIDDGARTIAYIGGLLSTSTGCDRLAGHQDALTAAGITVDPGLLKLGRYSEQTGYLLVKELLRAPIRLDALAIGNSRQAIGALHALAEARLRVPEDVAIAAFHDSADLDEYSPFMTSVIQPAYDIGRIGTRRLFERIAGQHTRFEEFILPNRIVMGPMRGVVLA